MSIVKEARCAVNQTANNPVYIWLKITQFCLLCDEPSDSRQALCSACEAELPWLARPLPAMCALPLPSSGQYSAVPACASLRPSAECEAAWRYDFPVDSLITRFKHQAQWPLGRLLGELLSDHLQHAFSEGLPRPSGCCRCHCRQRQRQRGFNQARMLAQWLGQHLHIDGERAQCLQRRQDTRPSNRAWMHATPARNLRQAFALATEQPAGRPPW